MAYPYGDPYSRPYYYAAPPPANLAPLPTRPRAHSHGRMGDPTVNVYVPGQVPVPDYDRGREREIREIRRLEDEIYNLHLDRSRSRSRHHYHRSSSRSVSDLERELERKKHELHEQSERMHADDHEKDIIARWENKRFEKERKEEETLKEMKIKIEAEALLKKEKEEKAYKEFEALQAKKKLEEKLKKEEEEKKIEEGTRESLRRAGFSENQIDRTLAQAKRERDHTSSTTTTNVISYQAPVHHGGLQYPGDIIVNTGGPPNPTYTRVHRHDISIDVLAKYGIPWTYDHPDTNYLIVKSHVDRPFLELLHEETRKHKKGGKTTTLRIEGKKKHHSGLDGLQIVRHRSKSRSRSHSHSRGDVEKIVVYR